ncbi:conserved hypothetical protein [Citreicella sp. SE45]|nr:conserved hypothetical protein [Citreicella sp. SE45]
MSDAPHPAQVSLDGGTVEPIPGGRGAASRIPAPALTPTPGGNAPSGRRRPAGLLTRGSQLGAGLPGFLQWHDRPCSPLTVAGAVAALAHEAPHGIPSFARGDCFGTGHGAVMAESPPPRQSRIAAAPAEGQGTGHRGSCAAETGGSRCAAT